MFPVRPLTAIEAIPHEPDFKVACDGLLRHEFGPLVQTYAGSGTDGGIDAEFRGRIGRVTGRWVFQFKFRSPWEGLTQRRNWLNARYLGKKSEFDKPGVEGASGYVIMTNVPTTVGMVKKLRTAWRERRSRAPLLVWDPSRLDSLLKDHEHLARSWSGLRETRCHQAVIVPLWCWLEDNLRLSATWQGDPMWPLEIVNTMIPEPVPTFRVGYEATYRLTLDVGSRVRPLFYVRQTPHFQYASTTPYRRALDTYPSACTAVMALADAVRAEILAYRPRILDAIPRVAAIPDPEKRDEVATLLAYCVLEPRWGYSARWAHSISNDRLFVRGTIIAWEEPGLAEIEPALNALVGEAGRGQIPQTVQDARARVWSELNRLTERLWQPLELGVDAESGEG